MENKYHKWLKDFQKATDFDAWGQPIEAADIYLRVSKQIESFTEVNKSLLDEKYEETGLLLAKHLNRRANDLICPEDNQISLKEIKDLRPDLCQLISHLERRQSIVDDVTARFQSRALSLDTGEIDSDTEGHPQLMNQIKHEDLQDTEIGKSYLTIKIEKIGIKDASSYNSPFIVISVKDSIGIELTECQKTPCSTIIEANWIHFDTVISIPRPLEDMPQGFSIFFELKHYKLKKNYYSTKCYSFIDKDEIKNGAVLTELYTTH